MNKFVKIFITNIMYTFVYIFTMTIENMFIKVFTANVMNKFDKIFAINIMNKFEANILNFQMKPGTKVQCCNHTWNIQGLGMGISWSRLTHCSLAFLDSIMWLFHYDTVFDIHKHVTSFWQFVLVASSSTSVSKCHRLWLTHISCIILCSHY